MYKLPDLPYDYDALEPVISKKIMQLHHDKHHAGYVNKANEALAGTELEGAKIEEVLQGLDTLPEGIRKTVRNNGGGHANHSLFWLIMREPKEDNRPSNKVSELLNTEFGGFDAFKVKFEKIATTRFGSGWAWMVKKDDGTLGLYSTPNQDSPILKGDIPILGLDVWEHAYYLDYMNDRGSYVSKWWDVVNWQKVEELLEL